MKQTRRNLIKTAVAAVGGLSIVSHSVAAESVLEDQFLVDTESSDTDAWRGQVEIIDEAEQSGFASVKGSESDLEGYGLDHVIVGLEADDPERAMETFATEVLEHL